MKADERFGDVITTYQVENEPCCGILDWLERDRQVDQETVTVAIVQPAEDECRNRGIEDGRRYAATNASQLWQSSETLSVERGSRGSSSSDLDRWKHRDHGLLQTVKHATLGHVQYSIHGLGYGCNNVVQQGNDWQGIQIQIRYDTIRDAILTCARKPT